MNATVWMVLGAARAASRKNGEVAPPGGQAKHNASKGFINPKRREVRAGLCQAHSSCVLHDRGEVSRRLEEISEQYFMCICWVSENVMLCLEKEVLSDTCSYKTIYQLGDFQIFTKMALQRDAFLTRLQPTII